MTYIPIMNVQGISEQPNNLEQIIQSILYPGYKWLTSASRNLYSYLLESANKKINYTLAHFIHIAFFLHSCT